MDDNNKIYTTKLESLVDVAQILGQQNDYEDDGDAGRQSEPDAHVVLFPSV